MGYKSKLNSPCIECPNLGCGAYHDKCAKYVEYVLKLQSINNDKAKAKDNEWKGFYERNIAGRTSETPKSFKRGNKHV